jgi:hypothetical protein
MSYVHKQLHTMLIVCLQTRRLFGTEGIKRDITSFIDFITLSRNGTLCNPSTINDRETAAESIKSTAQIENAK